MDRRGGPDVPTPVTDDKYFYMVDDQGLVTCLDAKTARSVWGPERTALGTVSASPLLADGKLYITNEKAVTTVLAAGPEFKVLATNELDGSYTLSSIAVAGRDLFLRTSTHLYLHWGMTRVGRVPRDPPIYGAEDKVSLAGLDPPYICSMLSPFPSSLNDFLPNDTETNRSWLNGFAGSRRCNCFAGLLFTQFPPRLPRTASGDSTRSQFDLPDDRRRTAGGAMLSDWARRFDLSEPEFLVLWCLRMSTVDGVDQTTIAQWLALSPAQVSADRRADELSESDRPAHGSGGSPSAVVAVVVHRSGAVEYRCSRKSSACGKCPRGGRRPHETEPTPKYRLGGYCWPCSSSRPVAAARTTAPGRPRSELHHRQQGDRGRLGAGRVPHRRRSAVADVRPEQPGLPADAAGRSDLAPVHALRRLQAGLALLAAHGQDAVRR